MSLNWLPLTEYSSKHRVSISTLRRRIKAKDIKYQLKEGRYLIAEDASELSSEGAFQGTSSQTQRPSLKDAHGPSLKKSSLIGTHENLSSASPATAALSAASTSLSTASVSADEPILTAANRLLTELKKAYTQILQEKEEQILHLKEEVADLKTLVRVLESENQRLQR